MSPQLPGEMEPWPCLHCCRWQFPGKGPRRGRDHPGESCLLHRVPCLTLSLVWVSFRSHGWLQHGRRPEGARGQRTSRLPGSCWHLVSPPLSNRCELETGRENPRQKRGLPFCFETALAGINLFRIPILLFTLGGLENSRLLGSDTVLL